MITFQSCQRKQQQWLGREMMKHLKFESKSLILVSLSLLSSNLFEENCSFSLVESGNSQHKSQSGYFPVNDTELPQKATHKEQQSCQV